MRRLAFFLLAALTAPAIALSQTDAPPVPGLLPWQDAERVANGAQVYEEYCAACHGANLEGEPNWREQDADGYLPAPPHDESGHTWHHADDLLVRIVTLGTEALVGGNYKSNMIGFSDQLTPDEILDSLAFIKSTWPDEVIEMHNQINARAGLFNDKD